MKIMRVLHSMDYGGIERGVYDFSKKAIELGHEIVIVSWYGRFLPELIEKGIKWYKAPLDKKNIITFLIGKKIVEKVIKIEKPDIVHFESRFPCWIGYFLMRKFKNIPFITSIHSFSPFHFYSQSQGKGDIVIVVSKALKEYAVKKLRVPEDKIRIVYNGIDINDFLIEREFKNKNEWKIGMVGRFSILKGHFYFVEAIENLIKEGIKNIKGLIYGAGSKNFKMKLKNLIKKKNLDSFIEIIEKKNSKEIMKEIDILVVPSIEPEGFGRVVVEGMVSGIPVIATNIGGVCEIIEDSKTGFLVEPKNSKKISEKIKEIINDKNLYKKISREGQKFGIENFSVEKMVKETLKVYEEVLIKK
ncbi:MAG: glycosyltransferase family 4 protein [Candidatus Ratteibacteria bacterium]